MALKGTPCTPLSCPMQKRKNKGVIFTKRVVDPSSGEKHITPRKVKTGLKSAIPTSLIFGTTKNTCSNGARLTNAPVRKEGNISVVLVRPISLQKETPSSIPQLVRTEGNTGKSDTLSSNLPRKNISRNHCEQRTHEKPNQTNVTETLNKSGCIYSDWGQGNCTTERCAGVCDSWCRSPEKLFEEEGGSSAPGKRRAGKAIVFLTHFWSLYMCSSHFVACLRDEF